MTNAQHIAHNIIATATPATDDLVAAAERLTRPWAALIEEAGESVSDVEYGVYRLLSR